ncbi:MAG TPA: L,D-transpeptidase [Pyrinomonadaceae bacterium]|nr:L,D-transpeptidase [Pyrinomonadaceae bacterium]
MLRPIRKQIAKTFRLNLLTPLQLTTVVIVLLAGTLTGAAQETPTPTPTPSPTPVADRNESERSDRLTGGHIEVAEFAANEPNIRLTLNIPTFRLTLWQNDKEVKSYYIGVGKKEHPLYIGAREATQIIWNPAWIPPPSDWVREMTTVTPGEVIPASDARNPLGKMKIPLGDRYLIHQAASLADVGNLVSHGCVRMPKPELYDLADRIIAARGLPVSRKRIDAAKRGSKMFVVSLKDPLPVDINYDTLVVEEGVLHVYADVYGRGTNRPALLRAKLQAANVDVTQLNDVAIRKILGKATRRAQFVVETRSIAEGRALEDGKLLPVIPRTPKVRKG